ISPATAPSGTGFAGIEWRFMQCGRTSPRPVRGAVRSYNAASSTAMSHRSAPARSRSEAVRPEHAHAQDFPLRADDELHLLARRTGRVRNDRCVAALLHRTDVAETTRAQRRRDVARTGR